jgi:hypothetical protein
MKMSQIWLIIPQARERNLFMVRIMERYLDNLNRLRRIQGKIEFLKENSISKG